MAFSPNQKPSTPPDSLPSDSHGLTLSGILRRIDERTVKNGKNAGERFRILKITSENGRFELFEVLDFSQSPFQVGDFIALPVSVSARVTQSGYAQISISHRADR